MSTLEHYARQPREQRMQHLTRTGDALAAAIKGQSDAVLARRPDAKNWAAKEIVCHLRDEEAEDFGARLRVVIEGGAAFAAIDPERWARERRYREDDGPRALALFRDRRTSTLALLGSTAAARLTPRVAHPRTGALSGLDLLAAWVAHDRLHLAQLAATLARGWADRWAPLRTDYAGPIPYGAPTA